MADLNYDELRSMEEERHKMKMKEIAFEAREQRKTENLKAENAQKLEEQKDANAKKIEGRKIVGAIVKGVLVGVFSVATACFLDRHDFSRKNIPKDKW